MKLNQNSGINRKVQKHQKYYVHSVIFKYSNDVDRDLKSIDAGTWVKFHYLQKSIEIKIEDQENKN